MKNLLLSLLITILALWLLVKTPEDTSLAVVPAWVPPEVARWAPQVQAASQKHGIPFELGMALVLVESLGNPVAVSISGCRGLTQVCPIWVLEEDSDKLFDPDFNLDKGFGLLAVEYRALRNWSKAVAAYNDGRGNAMRNTLSEQGKHFQWAVMGIWNEFYADSHPTFENR